MPFGRFIAMGIDINVKRMALASKEILLMAVSSGLLVLKR